MYLCYLCLEPVTEQAKTNQSASGDMSGVETLVETDNGMFFVVGTKGMQPNDSK